MSCVLLLLCPCQPHWIRGFPLTRPSAQSVVEEGCHNHRLSAPWILCLFSGLQSGSSLTAIKMDCSFSDVVTLEDKVIFRHFCLSIHGSWKRTNSLPFYQVISFFKVYTKTFVSFYCLRLFQFNFPHTAGHCLCLFRFFLMRIETITSMEKLTIYCMTP